MSSLLFQAQQLTVLVGAITAAVVGWQAWETRKSAQAARAALIAQFRPLVVVRSVRLNLGDESIDITVILANKGASKAVITAGEIVLDHKYKYSGAKEPACVTPICSLTLEPGEDHLARIQYESLQNFYFAALSEATHKDVKGLLLQCSGRVEYTDGNNVRRKTAFRREYDFTEERFVPSGSAGDEYED